MATDRARILIVEDEVMAAAQYRRALSAIGDSLIVEQASQMVSELRRFGPQVVVLDIWWEGERVEQPWNMGVRLLQEVRQLEPPLGDVPVVVVTGRIDDEVEAACRAQGIAALLRKPLPLEALREAVRAALGQMSTTEQKG